MPVAKSTLQQIEVNYDHAIKSIRQPALIYEQTKALIGNFGIKNTFQTLWYKAFGEHDDLAFTVITEELKHALSIRKTHSDLCNIIDVFCRRTYDLPASLMRKVGSKAIVDLGGYNGTTASFFANQFQDSQVLAIEPNPRNFPLLTKNTAPYGDQIKTIHAAAAPERGFVFKGEFGFHTDSMQNAFMIDSNKLADEVELSGHIVTDTHIPAITPDDILDHLDGAPIGILKVDIEGAEKPLFKSSAINELLRRTQVLMIETHDQLMPGCSRAVKNAAQRNDMTPTLINPHTEIFYRQ